VKERVTGGTVELPVLTRSNYHEWSLVMKVSLEALGLWDAVVSGSVDRSEDRLALATILRVVPPEMKVGLAVKKSAKVAWEAVKSKRVGDDRVKLANVQCLLKEFENVVFRVEEPVDEFAVRIDGLVASLRELGEEMEDSRVVKKILPVVPRKLRQVVVAIEMLTDLNTMFMEGLVGRLRVAEATDVVNDVGWLLLTEGQWEELRRQRSGKQWARDDDARRRRNKKGADRGGGHDEDDDDTSTCSGTSRRSERRN
jgi:hypothetical protein